MSFVSFEFMLLFASVFVAYWTLRRTSQNVVLLAASYLFYGWWDWRFLSLIAGSTALDYIVGRLLDRSTDMRRRWLLAISVVANLSLLGFFKYFGFFTESFKELLSQAGFGAWADAPTLEIILPVGISFYTFQTLSYTIDVYRGRIRAHQSLLEFALFVSFFPQLVAGPIERASHFLPQIQGDRVLTWDRVSRGGFLILFGFFKKLAIADGVAPYVDRVFADSGSHGGEVLLAVYLFALQIYADFSGYSDIARGTSKLLGFDLMVNFRVPYFSVNPSEFWRRWHISLSSWLRDYLYIPLGGNQRGAIRTYRNLMITMLLGGLWHGAAWNFVIWGAYQGALLCGHRLLFPDSAKRPEQPLWRRLAKAVVFFQFVSFGWLLFRCDSLAACIEFGARVLSDPLGHLAVPGLSVLTWASILMLVACDFLEYRADDPRWYERWPLVVRAGLCAALVVLALGGLLHRSNTFIYFQF